ncbi:MAG TPA: 6-phosphogluconolactonase [Clostridiales bacterium]|nr:lactonase family protein [Clostridia bacterium]MDD4680032.1 lactonase family protein [Clostridia bacterium]HCS75438.1 6-phosphogluconolactonase [Clostridiales bacterium]
MSKILYYIGTYTSVTSKGIYGTYFDSETQEFSKPELFAELPSPTYMVSNKNAAILYSVSEIPDKTRGKLSAYSIEPSAGKLSKINEVNAPGLGLCHISIDPTEKFLFAASYPDATVQVYPILEDGSVGEAVCVKEHVGKGVNKARQEKAHAHHVCLTPDQKYLCACDLGIDKVMVYRFDINTGQLELDEDKCLKLPDGCGPRHMIFNSNGQTAYVLSELSSQVFVLSYQADKGFTILQTINALEQDDIASDAAAIRISSDDRFLYTSNRGEDSLALFHINEDTGLLERISNSSSGGQHPRDFILTDSLLLCANRDSDNIVVYQVSEEDGTIEPVQEVTGVSKPVNILEYHLE